MVEMVERSYDGDEPPDDDLSATYQQLAVRRNASGDYRAGLRAAERSAELSRGMGDEIRLAIADSTRISSLAGLGQFHDAAQLTRELAQRTRGQQGTGRVLPRAILSGFSSLLEIGAGEEAEALLSEGLDACSRYPAAEYDFAALAILRGDYCFQQGRPADAVPTLRDALAMPPRLYPEELRPRLYQLLLLCHGSLHQMGEAQSVLRSAMEYPWSAKGRLLLDQMLHAGSGQSDASPPSVDDSPP